MGKLETASPRFSFRLGFLLLGVFPTDILTSWAVGTYLSNHGDPWWHLLPFVLLTLLLLALPALLLLAVRSTGAGIPAEGARLDGHALVDRWRGRDRVFHRHRGQQPPGLATTPDGRRARARDPTRRHKRTPRPACRAPSGGTGFPGAKGDRRSRRQGSGSPRGIYDLCSIRPVLDVRLQRPRRGRQRLRAGPDHGHVRPHDRTPLRHATRRGRRGDCLAPGHARRRARPSGRRVMRNVWPAIGPREGRLGAALLR